MEKPAETTADLHPLLMQRWSPRAFSERSVPEEVLTALLEAARWAPSAYNAQPWRYLVARREESEAFARLLSVLAGGNQPWARKAGVLILTVAQTHLPSSDKPNPHSWHDVGLASAQLTLQATMLGLGVHQMAGFSSDKARELFGIPEGFEPVTAIAVGYPDAPDTLEEPYLSRETAPRSRHPLADLVFKDAWGATRSTGQ